MKLDHRKYSRIIEESAGLNRAYNQTSEKRRDAYFKIKTAESTLNAELDSLRSEVREAFLSGSIGDEVRARIPKQILDHSAELAELRADLADLEAVEARMADEWRRRAGPIHALESFFMGHKDRLPRAERADHTAPKRKATPADLEKIREQIAETAERIEWIGDAPLPLEEACKQFDANFEHFASEYRLPAKVGGLFYAQGGNATGMFRALVGIGGTADLGPLVCALFPEIRERIHALMADYSATLEQGPPTADRARLLRELTKAMFVLEVEEERLICALESEGHGVARRHNANPAAILGVFETADPWAEWTAAK
jgi:hypothetical protein